MYYSIKLICKSGCNLTSTIFVTHWSNLYMERLSVQPIFHFLTVKYMKRELPKWCITLFDLLAMSNLQSQSYTFLHVGSLSKHVCFIFSIPSAIFCQGFECSSGVDFLPPLDLLHWSQRRWSDLFLAQLSVHSCRENYPANRRPQSEWFSSSEAFGQDLKLKSNQEIR